MKEKNLTETIESLPEILTRKANLEAHTNILQALMKQIAARDVPTFFEIEQTIITTGRVDKIGVITLLKDGSKGNIYDKTRLLAIIAVSGDTTILKSYDEIDNAYTTGCSEMTPPATSDDIHKKLAGVLFLRRLQSLQTPISQRFGGSSGIGGTSSTAAAAASISSLLTSAQSRASSFMAKAASSFFTKFSPAYVTRVTDNLSEGRSCPEEESWGAYDARLKMGENVDLKGQK